MKTWYFKYGLLLCISASSFGVEPWPSEAPKKQPGLQFFFEKGDILEVRKYAYQKIRVNRTKFNRQAFNYIRLQVTNVQQDKFTLAGRFQSRFRYEIDEEVPYLEEENEFARFTLLANGKYEVPQGQFMPNLRSIPTFPKTMEYKKGFTWTAPAQEIMKFQKLLVIPLEVQYEYRGSSVLSTPEGVKKLHKILINYEISKEFREADNQTPSKVFGFVTGILFFDDAAKIPYYEQSEYNLVILFPNGDSREFNVKSKTYYKKIPHTKKTIEAKELAKEFRKKLIPEKGDVNPKIRIRVRKDEVKINLPNVFFETDSAELTDESKEALDSIIKIIKEKAPNAQIVIRGFTDNRGSEEYNLKLSEKRAKAVADYLVEEGELKPENISYLGLGEKRPIASNRTAEGRAKNRRVEVLIYP